MTQQFRSDVQATLEAWRVANFPTIPAFYENGPVPDEESIGPIWLDISVRWYGAKFVTVGERPFGRHTGVIATNVYYRSGEGSALPDQVLDSIKGLLRAKRLGPAVLHMPQRTTPTDVNQWYKAGLMTPFTLDDA